jgi:hypothetical protein
LLGIARGLPRWDALFIVAENENYPWLHVRWHEGHGFVVQCFEDGESWGFFLVEATAFSPPEIEIEMGGRALEKWPRQLCVGRQNETQHWVRNDAFPREIVWETREGREAGEKAQERRGRP